MIEHSGKNFPGLADIIEALQAKPDGLGARLCVALASEESAQTGHHPNGLAQSEWLRWRYRIFANETHQSFPLHLLKIDRAGHIRGFSSELGQMKYPPRHHQIDRQTGFNAIGAAQLPSLNLAAALEGAMEYFDAPAPRIPAWSRASIPRAPPRQGRFSPEPTPPRAAHWAAWPASWALGVRRFQSALPTLPSAPLDWLGGPRARMDGLLPTALPFVPTNSRAHPEGADYVRPESTGADLQAFGSPRRTTRKYRPRGLQC